MKEDIKKYGELICDYVNKNYKDCFREPKGLLKYPFIVPGSQYKDELWDWDSWLTDLALGNYVKDDITEYEKGCVLNFLDSIKPDNSMPIFITSEFTSDKLVENRKTNSHKPMLAQHALFVVNKLGDAKWLEEKFDIFFDYLSYYEDNCKHEESGLYFWYDDFAIGVDTDPCTFYRPNGSSASIYLNCLMYQEYKSLAEISKMLGKTDKEKLCLDRANALENAIQENCWDERNGFFYSCDINLNPVDPDEWLHSGAPRHWKSIIERIDVWSGFLAMWYGIATKEQAERMVKENYLNERTFYSDYGICSLGKSEKMYKIQVSGNPSCWLGPIWGISNFVLFESLLKYGYTDLARDMAEKTVTMFGRDIEKHGEMHEYYDPETGEGVHNRGFQSWNVMSVLMYQWLKDNT